MLRRLLTGAATGAALASAFSAPAAAASGIPPAIANACVAIDGQRGVDEPVFPQLRHSVWTLTRSTALGVSLLVAAAFTDSPGSCSSRSA